MLEKNEILLVIYLILLAFYLVISLGAGKNRKSAEIKGYLFNVRILILFIGIVATILWIFF